MGNWLGLRGTWAQHVQCLKSIKPNLSQNRITIYTSSDVNGFRLNQKEKNHHSFRLTECFNFAINSKVVWSRPIASRADAGRFRGKTSLHGDRRNCLSSYIRRGLIAALFEYDERETDHRSVTDRCNAISPVRSGSAVVCAVESACGPSEALISGRCFVDGYTREVSTRLASVTFEKCPSSSDNTLSLGTHEPTITPCGHHSGRNQSELWYRTCDVVYRVDRSWHYLSHLLATRKLRAFFCVTVHG